jgi:hypothetical protein
MGREKDRRRQADKCGQRHQKHVERIDEEQPVEHEQ